MPGHTGRKSGQRVVASTIAVERRRTAGCKMNQAVFQWLSNLLRRACKIPFQHGTNSVLMLAGVVVVGLWVLVQWALVPRRTDAPLGYP